MNLFLILRRISIFCLVCPLTLSIKLNPKIVTTTICKNEAIGRKRSLNGTRSKTQKRATPPAAFIKIRPDPVPQPASEPLPLPFLNELILFPALIKLTSTILIPWTKACCNRILSATKNAAMECGKIFVAVATFARKVPGQLMKAIGCINQTCTPIVKKGIEASVDFCEDVAEGFLDGFYGTKLLMKDCISYTYNSILLPFISTTEDAISKVTEDVVAWIEDVTMFTFRLITLISQDTIHFLANFSLETAYWIKHYSYLSMNFFVTIVQTASLTVFQTILNIPVWITDITDAALDFFSMLLVQTKRTIVGIYKDILILSDKMVEAAPFLIRYEEDGEEKLSLTPTAQMVLYIISTIYAAQPMLAENSRAR